MKEFDIRKYSPGSVIGSVREGVNAWINKPPTPGVRENLILEGAAPFLINGILRAELPAYVPTGELPLVNGSPEPMVLEKDFNGDEFVQFAIDGARVRTTTEVLNGANNNFVKEYIAAGTYGRIDNTPTPLPDGTTLPGGTGVDGIGNDYPWAKVEILDESKAVGYTAESVGGTEYLTHIEGDKLPPELQAPYIEEVEVKLPPRTNTNARSLATLFDRDSVGGTINDIDNYIVHLWGDSYSKKNIQQTINGVNQTVQVEVTPTRDELTEPLHALKRLIGVAALEVFPREGYPSPADPDGIVVLSAFGGMKVGQNTTIDTQNQDSEAQKRQDIITRVKDQFIVFRAAQKQTDESPTISEASIGLTDWNGFVAYIGDVEKAQRIAEQLTDVGGTDPSTLLRQIGALKQSGVFLPIKGGGFARKVDATLAQTLDPTGPRINNSTMKVLYSIDKDSGQTIATVSNRTSQLGTMNAVQNTETGEWEWEKAQPDTGEVAEVSENTMPLSSEFNLAGYKIALNDPEAASTNILRALQLEGVEPANQNSPNILKLKVPVPVKSLGGNSDMYVLEFVEFDFDKTQGISIGAKPLEKGVDGAFGRDFENGVTHDRILYAFNPRVGGGLDIWIDLDYLTAMVETTQASATKTKEERIASGTWGNVSSALYFLFMSQTLPNEEWTSGSSSGLLSSDIMKETSALSPKGQAVRGIVENRDPFLFSYSVDTAP